MEFKPGSRCRSQVCETEMVVVKVGGGGDLTCGGVAVVPLDATIDGSATMAEGQDGGTLLGKRYCDEASGLEILCVKPGAGSLAVDGRPLELKTAKALPSSD